MVAEATGMPEKQISRKTGFYDDIGCDSLDVTGLIMTVEKKFNISIPDDLLENIKTVGDLTDLVSEKKISG